MTQWEHMVNKSDSRGSKPTNKGLCRSRHLQGKECNHWLSRTSLEIFFSLIYNTYKHIHIHLHTFTYTYIYIYIHIYVYIYTYIHTHTYIYIYTRVCIELLELFHKHGLPLECVRGRSSRAASCSHVGEAALTSATWH